MFKFVPGWAWIAGLGVLAVGTTFAVVQPHSPVGGVTNTVQNPRVPNAGDRQHQVQRDIDWCSVSAVKCLGTDQALNNDLSEAKGIFGSFYTYVTDPVQKASLQDAENGLNDAFTNAQNALTKAGDKLAENLQGAESRLNDAFKNAQKVLATVNQKVQSVNLTKAEQHLDAVVTNAQQSLNGVVATVNGLQNSTVSTVNGVQNSTVSTVNGVQNSTVSTVNGVQNTVGSSSGSGSGNTGVSVSGTGATVGVNGGSGSGSTGVGGSLNVGSGSSGTGLSTGISTTP